MGILTLGNLITIGVVILILFLFRLLDLGKNKPKHLRSLIRLDTQLKTYENSLTELDRMTVKVQENISRIRDETAFVETSGKRITEVKNRLDELEKTFKDMGNKFQKENAEALGKTAENLTTSIKSAVSELGSTAKNIERQVEKYRRDIQDLTGRGREEWQAERAAWEKKDKALQEEHKKKILELESLLSDYEKRLTGDMTTLEEKLQGLFSRTGELVDSREESLRRTAETASNEIQRLVNDMKQEALEVTGEKLEEYRSAQEIEFRRLENLADDSRKLDIELRHNMQEIMDRIREDFAAFKQEAVGTQKAESEKFLAAISALKNEIAEVEKELAILKTAAYENVSARLKVFEDDFFSDLARRSGDIDKRFIDWQDNFDSQLSGIGKEADKQITMVRSSIEELDRNIREALGQTNKAEEIRRDMERQIEVLKADMDRLDHKQAAVTQLENEFLKIKRLEDELNTKMTTFLSEKRRIENMETDFNRLLQISRSVEDKLKNVSASDDTLQEVQLHIRNLEDALKNAEERYQRIEKKSEILDNTNEGIDRNFQVLQESEKLSEKINANLERYDKDLSSIKSSIESLIKENEKVNSVAEKVEVLNSTLVEIDERMDAMQRARQWIADAETRLEDLNKQAQTQARAIDSLVKGKKSGTAVNLGEGTPPVQKKENVITLARQGWKVDEIAKALKISRGEVELILDMAPRDL